MAGAKKKTTRKANQLREMRERQAELLPSEDNEDLTSVQSAANAPVMSVETPMAGSLGRADGISANQVARKIAANPQFAKVIFQELEGLVREKQAAAIAAQEEADRLASIRDGFDFERPAQIVSRAVPKAAPKAAKAGGRAPSGDTAKVREALFKAIKDAGKGGAAKGEIIAASGATQGQYALGVKALEKEGKIHMVGERKNAKWYAR